MKINVLPQSIANMIAAGEVVERPASVVKELTENSIDAGAKSVTIEIKKGGMSYIRITDDGCGIEPDQVLTAFKRHATSKIATEEDLNAIYTLGFRGEALASIAAVARIDIFTKTKDCEFGYCASLEGGEVTEADEAGCSNGTTMVVRDLFFNTPARMKFLKSDATETGYITDTVNKLILSHPEVAIKLIVNGKQTVSSRGDGDMLSALRAIYGRDYPPNMLKVDHKQDGMTVSGYVGNNALAGRDRRRQVFFINGRYIASKIISAAIGEAYQNTIMTGKFPVAFLNITLNGTFVDVNVHPTKTEVRFSDDKKVYQAVYWAVKNALAETKYVPGISFKSDEAKTQPREVTAQIKAREASVKELNRSIQADINLLRDKEFAPVKSHDVVPLSEKPSGEEFVSDHIKNNAFFSKEDLTTLHSGTSLEGYSSSDEGMAVSDLQPSKATGDVEIPVPETPPEPEACPASELPATLQIPENRFDSDASDSASVKTPDSLPDVNPRTKASVPDEPRLKAGIDFNVIGQVFATYIIVQKDNEMIIIDQHAAHERIYFESLLEEWTSKGISSQLLLLPATVSFEPSQFPLVADNLSFFGELGFECEVFGDNSIIVRAVPAAMTDSEIKDTVSEIAALLENDCNDIKKTVMEEALHTMACKRAIKGNSILTREEMDRLCEKVFAFDSINTCPHGRPIIVSMTKYELEKQFKRIV